MRVLYKARRAPGLERMRERVSRYAALAARFNRPSMMRWTRRYPQIIDHKMSSLQARIEVRPLASTGIRFIYIKCNCAAAAAAAGSASALLLR